MQIKRNIYYSLLLIFTLLFSFSNVHAADFRLASENKGNVYVEKNEEIKNLYTAGNVVTVDAGVQKGLHSAGNVVTINGNVGGTVYSGAGTLLVNGDVKGSVHGVGGSVIVNSKVADDLFIAGGNIVISKPASVGGDLFVGGGVVDIQGPVSGDAYINGGTIIINSEISGNLKIGSAETIKLGNNAKINGNFEYNSKNEIEIEEGASILGETSILENKLSEIEPNKGAILSIIFLIISLAVLVKIGGLIVIGLVLIYLFKNITEDVVEESLTNFWKNLGIGFLLLIVIPVTVIILFVTIVGVWLGIIIGVLYLLSILLAIPFASINFGSFILKVVRKRKNYSVNWKIVVGGVLGLMIVGFIPVIGGITSIVFMLISLGAFYTLAYRVIKNKN